MRLPISVLSLFVVLTTALAHAEKAGPAILIRAGRLLDVRNQRVLENQMTLAQMSTAHRVLLGARNAAQVLASGIASVRDLGNSGRGADVALPDAIRDGEHRPGIEAGVDSIEHGYGLRSRKLKAKRQTSLPLRVMC